MKHFLLLALLSNVAFAACPTDTLVKKAGAKTHYSLDLKTKYSQSDFTTYGCNPNTKVMTKEQQISVLDAEYNAKKSKI